MIVNNKYLSSKTINSFVTFITRLLQYRLCIISIPLLVCNFSVGIKFLIIAFLLDVTLGVLSSVIIFYKGIQKLERDKEVLLSPCNMNFNNELTSDIEQFFKDTNYTYNFRNKQTERIFSYIKCGNSSLIGTCLSYPFIAGHNIILVPHSFDSSNIRDKALLAHEFAHVVSHDLNEVSNINIYIYSLCLFIFSIIYSVSFSIIWPSIVIAGVCIFYCFVTHYNSLGLREMEANLASLSFIENKYGKEYMKEVALKLLKLRQVIFINTTNIGVLNYFSEYNQIYYLSQFVLESKRNDLRYKLIINKEKIQQDTNISIFKRIFQIVKLNCLLRIYKTTKQIETTNGLCPMLYGGLFIVSVITCSIWTLIMSFKLFSTYPVVMDAKQFVALILTCILLLVIIRFIIVKLWKRRLKLEERIGLQ